MRLFYRISDSGYRKAKLPGTNQEFCIHNFCEAFAPVIFTEEVLEKGQKPCMTIIADSCTKRSTTKLVKNTGMPTAFTKEGNAGSLISTIKLAIETSEDDEEVVYFCEDDYLHLPTAPILLQEISTHADYFTLYDHPDKYTNEYDFGETSKVIRTNSSHWRFTVSTCMTFGTKVEILKQDIDVWEKYTQEDHPHDHLIFTDLAEEGRKLALSIPGAACHLDLSYSGRAGALLIEPWATQMAIIDLEEKVGESDDEQFKKTRDSILNANPAGWNRLIALDALVSSIK